VGKAGVFGRGPFTRGSNPLCDCDLIEGLGAKPPRLQALPLDRPVRDTYRSRHASGAGKYPQSPQSPLVFELKTFCRRYFTFDGRTLSHPSHHHPRSSGASEPHPTTPKTQTTQDAQKGTEPEPPRRPPSTNPRSKPEPDAYHTTPKRPGHATKSHPQPKTSHHSREASHDKASQQPGAHHQPPTPKTYQKISFNPPVSTPTRSFYDTALPEPNFPVP